MSQQLGALQTHTTGTFLFISHTTNVLLFKFRCNIFIGVRIIKEMSGSVASGTRCIKRKEEDFLNAKNPRWMIKMSQFKKNIQMWWMKRGEIRRHPHRPPPSSKVTITCNSSLRQTQQILASIPVLYNILILCHIICHLRPIFRSACRRSGQC